MSWSLARWSLARSVTILNWCTMKCPFLCFKLRSVQFVLNYYVFVLLTLNSEWSDSPSSCCYWWSCRCCSCFITSWLLCRQERWGNKSLESPVALIFTPVTILLLCGEQIIPTRAKSIRNIQVPSSVLGRNRCFGLWLFIKIMAALVIPGGRGIKCPYGPCCC